MATLIAFSKWLETTNVSWAVRGGVPWIGRHAKRFTSSGWPAGRRHRSDRPAIDGTPETHPVCAVRASGAVGKSQDSSSTSSPDCSSTSVAPGQHDG